MPAATHTERTPPTLGTCRLISEGCTKTDAPMMIPTTIAVACSRPIGRSKAGRFPGAVKMRQCTTALEPHSPVTRSAVVDAQMRLAFHVGAYDPYAEDGRRRPAVGGFESHGDFLLVCHQIRGDPILDIIEADFLLGTAPRSGLFPDLLALHQYIAGSLPGIVITVGNNQDQGVCGIDRQVEGKPL